MGSFCPFEFERASAKGERLFVCRHENVNVVALDLAATVTGNVSAKSWDIEHRAEREHARVNRADFRVTIKARAVRKRALAVWKVRPIITAEFAGAIRGHDDGLWVRRGSRLDEKNGGKK